MPNFPVTVQNRVRRMPKRGHYDRSTVHAIIDEALVCHVAFAVNGEPRRRPLLRLLESVVSGTKPYSMWRESPDQGKRTRRACNEPFKFTHCAR